MDGIHIRDLFTDFSQCVNFVSSNLLSILALLMLNYPCTWCRYYTDDK